MKSHLAYCGAQNFFSKMGKSPFVADNWCMSKEFFIQMLQKYKKTYSPTIFAKTTNVDSMMMIKNLIFTNLRNCNGNNFPKVTNEFIIVNITQSFFGRNVTFQNILKVLFQIFTPKDPVG